VTIIQMLLRSVVSDYPAFVKPLDEPRSSTTALAPDSDLQFITLPNTIYYIRCAFIAEATIAPRLRWTIGHTGDTANAMFGARQIGNGDDPATLMSAGSQDFWRITTAMMAAQTLTNLYGGSATSTDRGVTYFDGYLSVGATGGVFSLNWAQSSSDSAPSTVKAGSWMHRQIVDSSEIKLKTADTSRTTDTAASADPDLQRVLTTSTTYFFDLGVQGSAGATPDFKIGLDDGGGTPERFAGYLHISENAYSLSALPNGQEVGARAITALTASTTQPMTGSDTANTGNYYDMHGIVRMSVAANPFALIWAQNTSSGTATTIQADSYLVTRAIDTPDLVVIKTSDEARISDATLTNDGELALALAADETYIVNICVLFNSNATRDFQMALTFDGTCDDFTGIVDFGESGPEDNSINGGARVNSFTGQGGFSTLVIPGSAGAADRGGARYVGLFRVGGSGGTLRVQWAQNSLGATNTTVLAGSYILAELKS
jgi:hypothetical protein